MSILIAEKDPSVADSLSALLKVLGVGHTVLAVGGTRVAPALRGMARCDLIITTLEFVLENDGELLRTIADRYGAVPVVVATPDAPDSPSVSRQLAKLRNVRLLRAIERPMDPNVLAEIVRSLWEKSGEVTASGLGYLESAVRHG